MTAAHVCVRGDAGATRRVTTHTNAKSTCEIAIEAHARAGVQQGNWFHRTLPAHTVQEQSSLDTRCVCVCVCGWVGQGERGSRGRDTRSNHPNTLSVLHNYSHCCLRCCTPHAPRAQAKGRQAAPATSDEMPTAMLQPPTIPRHVAATSTSQTQTKTHYQFAGKSTKPWSRGAVRASVTSPKHTAK